MMANMQGACRGLEEVLSEVENRSQLMVVSLNEFDRYVGSYALTRLVHRLAILSAWVSNVAESRHKEHRGQGYVCIFLSEAYGMNVYWIEDAKLIADKTWYRAWGHEVLTVDEAKELITGLVKQLGAGDWAEVVRWLERYGKSPGLDFDGFINGQ